MPRFRPYGLIEAKCPFYQTDSEKSISCSPPHEEIGLTAHFFPSATEKKAYMAEFCFSPDNEIDCPYRRYLAHYLYPYFRYAVRVNLIPKEDKADKRFRKEKEVAEIPPIRL